MIDAIECAMLAGNPSIKLFKKGNKVAEGMTPHFLFYVFESHGGPAPKIKGIVPETHDTLWRKTVDLL